MLASDVQVAEPTDRDRLRFSLTGEAGLNDGTAFPFVLLGLGLLGFHDLGASLWRWFAIDLVWAVVAGVAIGAALGTLVGRFVLYLRRTHKEAVGLDNFLALGLIGVTYGAGQPRPHLRLSRRLRRGCGAASRRAAGDRGQGRRRNAPSRSQKAVGRGKSSADVAAVAHADPDVSHAEKAATHPQHAPAFMAHAVLSFNEQIERIAEVVAVITVGTLLWAIDWSLASWGFVALLLLVIRPVSVLVGLAGSKTSKSQRALIGWFGIRGIGSLFYLAYAMNHGLAGTDADKMVALVLSVVVVSIVAHGISVTPLMSFYERRKPARGETA